MAHRTCAARKQSTQLSSLARSEPAGLLLATRRGSLDQGRGLACVSLVLEAEHRRVSSAHYLRHHEAHVDPRVADRFGDRWPSPGRLSPSTSRVEMDEGVRPAACAAATDFLPETGYSSIAALFSLPG